MDDLGVPFEPVAVTAQIPLLKIKDIYFASFLRTQGYPVAQIQRGFHATFTFMEVSRELISDYYNGREAIVSPKLLFAMFQDLRRMSRQIEESDGSEPPSEHLAEQVVVEQVV